jgi:hypothetical protein
MYNLIPAVKHDPWNAVIKLEIFADPIIDIERGDIVVGLVMPFVDSNPDIHLPLAGSWRSCVVGEKWRGGECTSWKCHNHKKNEPCSLTII